MYINDEDAEKVPMRRSAASKRAMPADGERGLLDSDALQRLPPRRSTGGSDFLLNVAVIATSHTGDASSSIISTEFSARIGCLRLPGPVNGILQNLPPARDV